MRQYADSGRSRNSSSSARFTLSWPTSTIVSSGWRASTMRTALAARAARSCSDSPSGKRTRCGVANHAANSAGLCALASVEGLELPRAVIDVVEVVANFGGDAAGLGDGGCGFDAAAHRARIDVAWPPGAGDALRDGRSLGAPARREFERLAAAKSLGLDAFDVAVPGQQNFGHARRLFPPKPLQDRTAHHPLLVFF